MLEHFEDYLRKEKRYAEHTVTAYMKDIGDFYEFAELSETNTRQLSEVSYQLIRGWMVLLLDQGISNRSVNRKLSSLRTFFRWASAEGVVTVNPMLKMKGPRSEKRLPEFIRTSELTLERTEPLFSKDFFGERDRLLLEIFYQTGIRLSECIELKEKDVNPGRIKVLGKRNKERIISISPELFNDLEKLMQMKRKEEFFSDYLFVTDKGVKMYPKFVYRKINKYLSKVTSLQKQSPHVLRHTFATHLLNEGVDIEVLREILGHANLAATQVYTHNSFARINEIYKSAHPRGHKKE